MKREMAIIGMIVCLAVGFVVGWFIPGLFAPAPGKTAVERIQDANELIVGTDAPWPPFELYNTTTEKWTGFDVELSQMIADELDVELTMTNIAFAELIGACQAGTIDMIAAAMMVTTDRAEKLAHSVPYIRVNEVIMVKEDSTINITEIEDLADYFVGCQAGTTQYYTLSDPVADGGLGLTEDIDFKVYPKADTLIQDLLIEAIDAAFVDEPVFTVYSKLYDLKTVFTIPAEPTALWCRWDEPELLEVINKVILEAYADGTMDELLAKWFE